MFVVLLCPQILQSLRFDKPVQVYTGAMRWHAMFPAMKPPWRHVLPAHRLTTALPHHWQKQTPGQTYTQLSHIREHI